VADALIKMPANQMLDALKQAADDALFDRTVDMVTTMSTMPDLRDRIHDRLTVVAGDDTRVVVGHSLGSVIAYRALVQEPYGSRVEDHLIDNGSRAHDPEPYLNAWATGAAIARALTG
jgi:alpha-beta hydrolase superfamily lysophospholipase